MNSRPLSELATVDWANLSDAYGSAVDVPEQLRLIAAGDGDAYDDAFGNLWHQWTIYSVTPHAIPFLIGILESGVRNADMLALLDCMGRGEGESKAEVMAALVHGLPAILPFLHSQDTEELQLSASLLGGLLELDERVRPALLTGLHSQAGAAGQLAFVYQLRRTTLDSDTLRHLQHLMSADSDDDCARGLQLACALALAFNQPNLKEIPGVLGAALLGWDAEQLFSDALFQVWDIFEDITSAARAIGQADAFAQVFWQAAQQRNDVQYLIYALALAHPTPDAPLTVLTRSILKQFVQDPRLLGYSVWLSEVHGLPAKPEELHKLLENLEGTA